MRALVTAGAVIAFGLGMWGCSGNGYSSGNGNPTGPTPPPSGSGVVTINVVAINGGRPVSLLNHPVMIGSVNQGTALLPCEGPYCY
jgi:hypothetical protein